MKERLLVEVSVLFAGPENFELGACQEFSSDTIGDNIQVVIFSDKSEICVEHRLKAV